MHQLCSSQLDFVKIVDNNRKKRQKCVSSADKDKVTFCLSALDFDGIKFKLRLKLTLGTLIDTLRLFRFDPVGQSCHNFSTPPTLMQVTYLEQTVLHLSAILTRRLVDGRLCTASFIVHVTSVGERCMKSTRQRE